MCERRARGTRQKPRHLNAPLFERPAKSVISIRPQDGLVAGIVDWLDPSSSRYSGRGKGSNPAWRFVVDAVYCYRLALELQVGHSLQTPYLPLVWWTPEVISRGLYHEPIVLRERLNAPLRSAFVQSANRLYDWLHEYGELYGWTLGKSAAKAQSDCNAGALTILLAKRENPWGYARAGKAAVIVPEVGGFDAHRRGYSLIDPLQAAAGSTPCCRYAERIDGLVVSRWWEDPKYAAYVFASFDPLKAHWLH